MKKTIRARIPIDLTLSPEAHSALAKLVKKSGESRSRYVERLILTAYAERRPKPTE